MSAQNFSVSQSGNNTLGGGATEATQLQVLAELQKQKEFTETIWVDSTGTFYIRRVVYSENLETYTISYTLADGTVYVPVAPSEPASAGTDRELVVTSYTVTTSGTGYAIGDIVHQINIFNVFDGSLLSTIWYNQTTDTIISPAPTIAHLTPEGSIQSIASATGTQADVAYTTGNGTIISLLKGLFGKFGTLGQKNMAGSAPVVIASDQSSIPTTSADNLVVTGSVTSATSVIASTETSGYSAVAVQVTSAGSTCTITYEVSNDNTTFFSVAGYTPLNLGDTVAVTASTTAIMLVFPISARYFRARVSTYGSGTVAATAVFKKTTVPTKSNFVGAIGAGTSTGALRSVTSTNDVMIGSLTETAPATDTASSGLNGRLQRAAQNLTALTSASGIAIDALTVIRNGVSDGTSWIRLKADANGRLEISPNPIAPTETQTVVQFTVNEAVSVSQNSAATATTDSAGGNWICITNNSGIVCDLTTDGTSGVDDGKTICTVIAGDTVSMPFKIAASTVLRIKPTSDNLTTSDYIQVRVS